MLDTPKTIFYSNSTPFWHALPPGSVAFDIFDIDTSRERHRIFLAEPTPHIDHKIHSSAMFIVHEGCFIALQRKHRAANVVNEQENQSPRFQSSAHSTVCKPGESLPSRSFWNSLPQRPERKHAQTHGMFSFAAFAQCPASHSLLAPPLALAHSPSGPKTYWPRRPSFPISVRTTQSCERL